MKTLKYGLIVSDFDGTLVKKDGTIAREVKNAIFAYQEKGGKFALSTGRLPMGILPHARSLGLTGVACCCNGAVIVDIPSGEVLFEGKIPYKTAVSVCKKLEKLGAHIHVYDVWEYYCNRDDEALRLYENATGTKAKLVTGEPLSVFLEREKLDVCKILVMTEPENADALMAELERERFAGCHVTKSAAFLVEVLNEKYSKGTAIDFLSKYYGVLSENTIGVGDQRNDIPMIERAGLGVAVQNADENAKAVADVVLTRTNEEGAVAELINEYAYE